jgi:hypothetical protein
MAAGLPKPGAAMTTPSQLIQPPASEYEKLPEVLRQYYTPTEYLWLSDAEKQRLEATETEPDAEE